ncbi:DNA-binding protein [Candidatus Mycoplasma haematolamae str. Purdue]|uniref:DNA-binding protein n=1 Tax=Mycoplasma haematolamae (strain Purdue) TaxID=1212765 RepID=I7B9P2_MYCHA|nr:HU family DNA-binding protein [Candidatus Mycoplasma haematolamae]AFO51970.1 DNA-binding protein [Candidatus Mycoplasma haematolamae str. Purdue]
MKKADLLKHLANKAGCTEKVAQTILREYQFVLLTEIQKEESTVLLGLGQIKKSKRSERSGFNPLTKAKITIPAREVPKFVPSRKLKDLTAGELTDIYSFEF